MEKINDKNVTNETNKLKQKEKQLDQLLDEIIILKNNEHLEQKLVYKAKQNQSTVIKVDPAYTSQCCPMCGHIEKANRNKKIHLFNCKNCGYKSNDDRIGAMNLYRMGINYLEDRQVPSTVTAE